MGSDRMTGAADAGARAAGLETGPAADGDDVVGGRESIPVGHDRGPESIEDLLSGPPSDDVPVTSGTYALYRATNGSVVLVLEDQKAGVKTIAVPRAMVAMVAARGRRKWVNPFSKGNARGVE